MNRPALPSPVAAATGALARWVRDRFGSRVARLTLFGSFARGEGRLLDSDVDVLVVVQALSALETREVVEEAARISSRFNVLLSPVTFSAEAWAKLERQQRLLAKDVERDGVGL